MLIQVPRHIWPAVGQAIFQQDNIGHDFLQGLAVFLVKSEEKKREHEQDHDKGRDIGSEAGLQEKVAGQPKSESAAEANQLPGRQVEGDFIPDGG